MKLATIRNGGQERPAVQLANGDFLDLTIAGDQGRLDGSPIQSIIALLDDRSEQVAAVRRLIETVEAENDVRDRLKDSGGIIGSDQADLAPPVTPKLILCTGSAYRDHMAEMKVKLPEHPAGFTKTVHAMIGARDTIQLPAQEPDQVDFESEFSIVFGRTCHNVTAEEALDYVAGYTMVNDVSSRVAVADWIASLSGADGKRSCDLLEKNILGKQFPSFCPIGPVITTKEDIPDPHAVAIGTRLNGELMQSANTKDLIFRIADVIAYFSHWYRFQPGDVLTTGSPAGVGYARDPKIFLKPGDVVEVFGEGIGSLLNPVG